MIGISLHGGSWEVAGSSCNAMASFDGGHLVNRWFVDVLAPASGPSVGSPLTWHPDYEAVRNQAPERTFALAAWLDDDRTGLEALPGVARGHQRRCRRFAEDRPLGVLTLEDYDGWMLGMSGTEDGYLVLIGDQGMSVFDAYDGRGLV